MQLGSCRSTKIATQHRRVKKPLLHQITKTPGPALRPNLHLLENTSPSSLWLLNAIAAVITIDQVEMRNVEGVTQWPTQYYFKIIVNIFELIVLVLVHAFTVLVQSQHSHHRGFHEQQEAVLIKQLCKSHSALLAQHQTDRYSWRSTGSVVLTLPIHCLWRTLCNAFW